MKRWQAQHVNMHTGTTDLGTFLTAALAKRACQRVAGSAFLWWVKDNSKSYHALDPASHYSEYTVTKTGR